MKSKFLLSALLCLTLCLATVATVPGCFGNAARDNVAVPALVMASESVVADARGGVATLPAADQPSAAVAVDTFANALATKDRAVIAADAVPLWPTVRSAAESGIAARLARGEIGPGVAASLRERLDRFQEVLLKLQNLSS